MNTLEHDYLELVTGSNILEVVQLKKNQLRQEAQAQQLDPEAYLNEHKKDILNLYKNADLGILCTLLENGHSWRNVTENYTGQPQIIRELDDAQEIRNYINDVLDMVQVEMNHRTKENFQDAYQAFASYREAEEGKYQNTDNLKEYIDGQLVIKLLVQDGYSQDTIKKVLKEHNYSEDYAKELTEKSMIVKRLYMDIANALPLSQSKNEFDVYRAIAKEYMAKMGIKVLSANDDLAIRKQLNNYNFPNEYLKKSFLKASPVAHEPARDPQQYVDAILSDEIEFKEELNQKKPIMDLEALYKGAIERFNQKLRNTGRNIIDGVLENKNRNYYDCLAAKELFDNHYTENEIYNAINKWSPEKENPAYPGYAQWVLDKANKLISKEKDILNHKKIQIPKASYQDLCDQGFTPTEMVISILQERMELNPSLKQRLYEPFMDKDLAESALTRYPDFNREALKGIINSFPRAILLLNTGLPEAKDYADNVIKAADARINETHKIQRAKEELKATFQSQQEIQHQGITGETANMKNNIYTLGRCALTMMQGNNDEHIIRDMIVANLPDADEKIITDIIQKNKECIKRAAYIKEYSPDTENTDSNPKGYYLSQMSKQYKIRNAFNASMDAEIAKDLKIMGLSRNEIRTIIQENSPIICQPGRGNDYVDKYVLPTALQRAMEELKKLKQYYPAPRHKEGQDVKEEYQYQVKKTLANIALPFMIEMDVIIAGVLLSQGFSDMDISTTLSQLSPLKDSQKEYGVAIVKAAENDEVRADADEIDNSMEVSEETNYIRESQEKDQPPLIAQETTVETTIHETYEGDMKVASEVIGQETKVQKRVLRPGVANP